MIRVGPPLGVCPSNHPLAIFTDHGKSAAITIPRRPVDGEAHVSDGEDLSSV
jgi:hypothetical protein